jgi:hypothetical protein
MADKAHRPLNYFERGPVWARDFTDLSYEWQPRD